MEMMREVWNGERLRGGVALFPGSLVSRRMGGGRAWKQVCRNLNNIDQPISAQSSYWCPLIGGLYLASRKIKGPRFYCYCWCKGVPCQSLVLRSKMFCPGKKILTSAGVIQTHEFANMHVATYEECLRRCKNRRLAIRCKCKCEHEESEMFTGNFLLQIGDFCSFIEIFQQHEGNSDKSGLFG